MKSWPNALHWDSYSATLHSRKQTLARSFRVFSGWRVISQGPRDEIK